VTGDRLVAGVDVKRAYSEKTGYGTDAEYAWFPGYQLVIAQDYSYLLAFDELRALDRNAHQFAGQWRTALLNERKPLTDQLSEMYRDRIRQGVPEEELETEEMKEVSRQIATFDAQLESVEDGVHKWRRPAKDSDAMILAASALIVGGDGEVAMVDAMTGEDMWSAEVTGRAVGLAVADGRLFVSTDTGATYCFAAGGADAGEVRVATSDAPYREDTLAPMYAKAADAIVAQTGSDKGFCLVLGSERGRLAYELAKRTGLRIVGIDPDPSNVAAARRALDAAGMYGRVTFEQGPLDKLMYSDYFANLIVSDTVLMSGKPVGDPSEVFRVLKPCGGKVCLGQPAGSAGMNASAMAAWLAKAPGAPEPKLTNADGVWVLLERGPLEGAGKWTHLYADTANTACSDDELVKGPLGVLWFGEPGPQYMVERHARTVAPVAMDGRLSVAPGASRRGAEPRRLRHGQPGADA